MPADGTPLPVAPQRTSAWLGFRAGSLIIRGFAYRAKGDSPRRCRVADLRDELAPFPRIELHSISPPASASSQHIELAAIS